MIAHFNNDVKGNIFTRIHACLVWDFCSFWNHGPVYYQPNLRDTNVSFEKYNSKSAKQALPVFFFPVKARKLNQRENG